MKFSGYADVDSMLRLKKPDEMKKMIKFAVEMIDLVPNKDDMFGIFSRKPEKVCVLPGLELSFERFLNEVGKLKPREKSTSKKEPAANKMRTGKAKASNVAAQINVDDLKRQMRNWMPKHNMTQGIEPTCTFMCHVCKWSTNLPIDETRKVSLSNAHRHYKGKQCEFLAAKANTSHSKLTNWMTPLGRKPSTTEPSFHVERDGKLVVGSSKSGD